MFDRSNKEIKAIEISAGLLAGYFLGAVINFLVLGKPWDDAFLDKKLIMGVAAIGLSTFLYFWNKKKVEN